MQKKKTLFKATKNWLPQCVASIGKFSCSVGENDIKMSNDNT